MFARYHPAPWIQIIEWFRWEMGEEKGKEQVYLGVYESGFILSEHMKLGEKWGKWCNEVQLGCSRWEETRSKWALPELREIEKAFYCLTGTTAEQLAFLLLTYCFLYWCGTRAVGCLKRGDMANLVCLEGFEHPLRRRIFLNCFMVGVGEWGK